MEEALSPPRRKGLAIFHASAAALGFSVLPASRLQLDLVHGLTLAAFLTFLLASAWTGYLLWRDDPRGRNWSIGLLIVQLPRLATPILSYSLFGPVIVYIKVETNFDIGMAAELATRLEWQWRGDVDPSMIGVNVVAVVLLYLWLLGDQPRQAVPTSGGLVVH